MYYIVKRGEVLSTIADLSTHNLAAAKEKADALHASFGDHWHVVKVETVWSTTTLGDLIKSDQEKANREEERRIAFLQAQGFEP
jgi:hypothetical protein